MIHWVIHNFQMKNVCPFERTTALFYYTELHMGRTWCQHAQLLLTSSPYVLTGSCELQNKMAALLSHIYKVEENVLPLKGPSQNMKFQLKFHNPLLIFNPGRIRRHSIRFFFVHAKTPYLGHIIYRRVIRGKAGAEYRFPFKLRHSSFRRTFL